MRLDCLTKPLKTVSFLLVTIIPLTATAIITEVFSRQEVNPVIENTLGEVFFLRKQRERVHSGEGKLRLVPVPHLHTPALEGGPVSSS